MSTYVIGDVQGCYDELQALLEKINFTPLKDALWFTGDLINRGPKSLEVMRFVSKLPNCRCVLGNHDLTLLALAYTDLNIKHHTLNAILEAPDREEMLTWLRNNPLLFTHDNYLVVHAGIPPQWSIQEAEAHAKEVGSDLRSEKFKSLLAHMFGNEPNEWSETLKGWDRKRFIINALTRLRFCDSKGNLDLSYKGDIDSAPSNLIPWFNFPLRTNKDYTILFGHWAALEGKADAKHVIALDTGCYWGGCLTAFRIEDRKRFTVKCSGSRV